MNRSISEFLAVSLPKALGGVCTVGLNLWLIQYLKPAEFGELSLCLVTVLLVDSMLGSPIDLGVIRLATAGESQTDATSLSIQKAALLLKGMVIAGGGATLAVCGSWVSRAFLRSPRVDLLAITLLAVGSLLILRSAQVNLQVERRFVEYGALDFAQMLVKFGGVALIVQFSAATPRNVLMWFVAGPALASCAWFAMHGHKVLAARYSAGATRELLLYTRWILITFALAGAISRMDLYLIARWGSLRESGIFAAGQAIAWMPQLVGTYLAIIVGPRIMPAWNERRLFPLLKRFQLGLFATAIVGYAVIILGLRWIGPIVFPVGFVRSQAVSEALLPGALAGFVTFPLVLTTLMFLRPKFLFLIDCISLLPVVALYFYIIPRFGAVGAAWVTTGTNVTRAVIAQVVAWNCARKNLAADVGPLVDASLGMPAPAGGRL